MTIASRRQTMSFAADRSGVRNVFATPIVVAPLHDPDELNAELKATILARRRSDEGVQRSNAGGWQSGDDFAAWSGEAGRELQALVTRLADTMTGVELDSGLERIAPAWKVAAWANVNEAGHLNRLHNHPASFWSAVYWVDAGPPDSGGEFEIVDPRGILPAFYAPRLKMAIPGCLSAGGSDFIAPESGTAMLFPSWLQHAVRPYTGAGSRVSVAFNFSV